jgi:hypothetical protein
MVRAMASIVRSGRLVTLCAGSQCARGNIADHRLASSRILDRVVDSSLGEFPGRSARSPEPWRARLEAAI